MNRTIETYLDELYRWNEKINLTSVERKDAEDVLITPSLSMLELIDGTEGLTLFDIGSGGGIPAVPLATMLPKCSFHLIESVAKKASFLTHVALACGLENILVVNGRTEKIIEGQEYFGAAHVVTARQVAAETVFEAAEWLLAPGGCVIMHKGPEDISIPVGFEKEDETAYAARYAWTGGDDAA